MEEGRSSKRTEGKMGAKWSFSYVHLDVAVPKKSLFVLRVTRL